MCISDPQIKEESRINIEKEMISESFDTRNYNSKKNFNLKENDHNSFLSDIKPQELGSIHSNQDEMMIPTSDNMKEHTNQSSPKSGNLVNEEKT